MKLLGTIRVLRALSLLISLISVICHISQCYLLNVYQTKTGIPDWLAAGHWQYLAWYISLSLSLAAGLFICFNAVYFRRPSMDKYISFVSLLCIFISVIAIVASDSMEPWTNGKTEGAHFLASCSHLFDVSKDELNSILYNRCLLNNTTCSFGIVLCIVWAGLTGISIYHGSARNSDTPVLAKNVIHPAVKEPIWGRYIPDPPTSVYSATIVDDRSGLLTPSSVLTRDKHTEFYSSVYYKEKAYSLKSSFSETDDYLKGGLYNNKASDYYYGDYTTTTSKTSSVYYNYGDTKSTYSYGGKDDEENHNENKPRDTPLLRVSTTFSYSPPSPGFESATTTTGTPLYEKFSRKTTSTFDSPSKYKGFY